MAIIYGELGDFERQEKFYLESAKADPRWGGALFNLALALRRRGEIEKAAACAEEAIERERDASYLVLRADLADRLGDENSRDKLLAEAITAFGPVQTVDDFDLSWLIAALRLTGDKDAMEEALAESRTRAHFDGSSKAADGELPDRNVDQLQ